jgi:hypothetical protein
MKVVTLCGSMRFQNEMMEIAEKLAREGECVLTPVYMVMKDCEISEEEVERLKLEQFKRIELADEIFVVDVDGYVGESTMAEIEFAERNGKMVRWMESRK